MADLRTTYLGIPLASPIIAAASSVSNMIDRIEKVEAHGAGALVIRSLFEEQALRESNLWQPDPQTRRYASTMKQPSVQSHLEWTAKTREKVQMPLIGSLNALHTETWVEYAQALESCGVDALELNFYQVETDLYKPSAEIEAALLENVHQVVAAVNIPVSVKLSPFFTSVAYISTQLMERGAKGVVLFNRFMQPDIDLEKMSLSNELHLSDSRELRLPLRWAAILSGRLNLDIALSTGVHHANDVIKSLLAGAQTVQVASTLLTNGIHYLDQMHHDLNKWLEQNGYDSVDAVRGKMNQQHVEDPQAFERAQYVKLLLDQR